MRYEPTIVTQPLKWGEPTTILSNVSGESYNIGLTQKLDHKLHLDELKPLSLRNKPYVYLELKADKVVDVITKGESFDIVAHLSEPLDEDITFKATITHNPSMLERHWFVSEETNQATNDDFDYLNELTEKSKDADYDKIYVDLTILAGQTTTSATINTIDDGVMFKGKGSYKIGRVFLYNLTSTKVILHEDQYQGLIMVEDSKEYPVYKGKVEVWVKRHKLLEFEPLIDPDTSLPAVIDLGYELEDDGLGNTVMGDCTSRSLLLDYLKVYQFQLRPLEMAEDINGVEDLSTTPPYYRAIIDVATFS